MARPMTVETFYSGLQGEAGQIARALRAEISGRWPGLTVKLAWGVPCWSGRERIFSIMSPGHRCNLQLWQGARLAPDYLGRIEGTGKSLRHVKIYTTDEIDDELLDIMEQAVRLDAASPKRVR